MPDLESRLRRGVRNARRLVVKVGSSSLTSPDGGHLDQTRIVELVDLLAARRAAGVQVVLVSSGAIAAGMGPLALGRRPQDLATQQAAASVGQGALVAAYQQAFGVHGLTVGQVLLTADDVTRRAHYTNARRTLERLLELGVVPIVNENDTVATHEIRFGDNDRLAALVSHLVGADALVLLTDVDALYSGPPRRDGSVRVPVVGSSAELATVTIGGTGSSVGRGGMVTKVEAAGIAGAGGVPTLLTRLEDAAVGLAGEDVGTVFAPCRGDEGLPQAVDRARDVGARPARRRRRCRRRGRQAAQVPPAGRDRRGTRHLHRGRPRRRVRRRRCGPRPRPRQLLLRRAAGAARPQHPRPGPRARPRLRARGHPPRRPRRPLTLRPTAAARPRTPAVRPPIPPGRPPPCTNLC